MKRYTYNCGNCKLGDKCGSEMRKDPLGYYVVHKDHHAKLEQVLAERDFIASEYALYLERDPSWRPKEDTTVAELLEEATQGIPIIRN